MSGRLRVARAVQAVALVAVGIAGVVVVEKAPHDAAVRPPVMRPSPTPTALDDTGIAVRVAMVRHECWTLQQGPPADMVGALPGHVLVVDDGAPRLGGDRLVGQALEQLPASITGKPSVDHGLEVAGFCR